VDLLINTYDNKKQKQACRAWVDNTVDDIVYGGSKGSAKSYTGISLIFSDAYMYPNTRYFIARKELNDLRKHTIPSIYEVFEHWGIHSGYWNYNGQDNYFKLYNGSEVLLLNAKYMPSDPLYERFGSMQMTRGMIEEAGEFERDAKNNLFASVGRWNNDKYGINGKVIQTCNPSKNYLYTDYYLKWRDGALPKEKRFIQAFPRDNNKLEPGYLESLERNLTESQKERLLYGNWEYSDDPDLVLSHEQLVATRSVKKEDGHSHVGADIARFGDDKTAFAKMKGNYLEKLRQLDQKDTAQVANHLITFLEVEKVATRDCGIDTVGLGAGVYDNMKEKNKTCVEIISGAKPTENHEKYEFNNLRSQMWWQFREDCINERICIDSTDEELLIDLTAAKYRIVREKVIEVESKDKIKARIGRSPDKGDAVVYANAMRAGIITNKSKALKEMFENSTYEDVERVF
jgi:phage terminase large subunit